MVAGPLLCSGTPVLKHCRVEVWYEDDESKTVRRVRLLDRQRSSSIAPGVVPVNFAALNPGSYPKIEISRVTFTGANGAPLRVVAKASVNRLYFPSKGLAVTFPDLMKMVTIEVGTEASQVIVVAFDATGSISASATVAHSQAPLTFNNVKELVLVGGAGEGFGLGHDNATSCDRFDNIAEPTDADPKHRSRGTNQEALSAIDSACSRWCAYWRNTDASSSAGAIRRTSDRLGSSAIRTKTVDAERRRASRTRG